MKNLQKLLYKVRINSVYGNTNISIENLGYDSRRIKKNSIFFAIKGKSFNGFDYIDKSIEKGAIAIISDSIPLKINKKSVYIIVDNVEIALGIISSNFYDNPSSKLKLIGITGTNGKTTSATLLYNLFNDFKFSAGLISTISIRYKKKIFKTDYTTPDPIKINSLLKSMLDNNGLYMLQNTKAKKYTLSINKHANFNLKISENLFSGMLLNFENNEFWTKLVGRFNAFNILTVISVSKILELDTISVLKKISKMDNVNGRFQIFNSKKSITVIVDYAHTPIALENVLNTINEIRTKNEKIITVVGCGGNRDKKKRPIIGKKAALLSDRVILTSDNPRNENPKKIIEDMIKGVSPSDYKKITKVTDREKAIIESERISKPGDIILIAGKGHENYQEINGKRNPFDDYEIVKKYF